MNQAGSSIAGFRERQRGSEGGRRHAERDAARLRYCERDAARRVAGAGGRRLQAALAHQSGEVLERAVERALGASIEDAGRQLTHVEVEAHAFATRSLAWARLVGTGARGQVPALATVHGCRLRDRVARRSLMVATPAPAVHAPRQSARSPLPAAQRGARHLAAVDGPALLISRPRLRTRS